jgi:hypothetical protein
MPLVDVMATKEGLSRLAVTRLSPVSFWAFSAVIGVVVVAQPASIAIATNTKYFT